MDDEFQVSGYVAVYDMSTNCTQVWNDGDDLLFDVPGKRSRVEMEAFVTVWRAGRERGCGEGAMTAQWNIRKALGLD